MKLRERTEQGFTLLELMLAVSIISLIVGFAVPNFEHIIEKNKADAISNKIYQTFQFAKSTAVSQSQTVYFCGTDTLASCDKQFDKYLVVFIDADDSKSPSAEEIIYQQPLLVDGGSVSMRASFGKPYTAISPLGSSALSGSIIYCPKSGESKYARRITWNRIARPYKAIDKDEDGNVDDLGEKYINCS